MLFNERDVVVRNYYNTELLSEAERRRALKGNDVRLHRVNDTMRHMRHWLRSLRITGSQQWNRAPQQPAR
jgi:hypothetical protein